MGAGSAANPLVVRTLEFMGGMAEPDGWRPEPSLPEIAFAGRSNVGKSSLLNKLVNRRSLARVSKTPGRTREINFFNLNDTIVLADLPGYGYAKVSKERLETWRPLIEGYLRRSPQLRGVVQLLDVRRDPTTEDIQMLEFLSEIGVPTVAAVTKTDKLKSREVAERLSAIAAVTGLEEEQMIPFSAVTGTGRDDLAAAIVSLVEGPGWREES